MRIGTALLDEDRMDEVVVSVLTDGGGGDLGVRLDHRVDAAVQGSRLVVVFFLEGESAVHLASQSRTNLTNGSSTLVTASLA